MAFLLGGANSAADTGFEVANSCRFNDGDSAKMSKTLGTATNNKKFTVNVWLKLGAGTIGANKVYATARDGTSGPYLNFNLQGSDNDHQLSIYGNDKDSANEFDYRTKRVFRDTAAWYMITVAMDTTLGAAGDRLRIYVNGIEETDFAQETHPTQDAIYVMNYTGYTFVVGARTDDSEYFDGYMAEFCMIDGSQLTPASFGEFDEDSPNIWKPKDVSGLTFGNNGFYLDFEDSGNLGNDANGGTDLTEANLAAADQATDTPTNNFCVMNPLANFLAGATFSEGNCQVVTLASNATFVEGTFGVTTGKWYWEGKNTAGSSVYNDIGITGAPSTSAGSDYLGYTANAYGYQAINGNYRHNSGASPTGTSYGDAFAVNDIIGVALNLDDNELKFYKNGTVQNSGTAIDINAASTTTQGVWMPAVGDGYNQAVGWAMNFGGCSAFAVSSANQDANGYGNFEYGVPSGFFALCTKNLAEYG